MASFLFSGNLSLTHKIPRSELCSFLGLLVFA